MSMKKNYSPGYLEITLQQFRKNTLAVFGSIVILLLFFVAIYAPLLANNKPLLLHAPFPDRYEDLYYIILSNVEQTIASEQGSDSFQKYADYTQSSMNKFVSHLNDPVKHDFLDFKYALIKEFGSLSQIDTAKIKKLLADYEDRFFIENIEPAYITLSPAVQSLTPFQIFFMVLYPLMLILVVLKNIFRKKGSRLSIRTEMLSALMIALAAAAVWHFAMPRVFDPTDYRELIPTLPDDAIVIMPPVPYGENENIITDASDKPSWLIPVEERSPYYHALGTDTNGRDVLCRMIWGTRIAMSVGFIAVGICLAIGIFFGAIAGYFRGWIDVSISRIVEIVICFPVFFLILTVLAFLRPSIVNIMVVIGVTGWTGIARLTRGEFLKLVKQDFVVAAHALGASNLRIIFKHILQNGLGPVLVAASFGIAGAILTESALSFLGFGVPQPTASWGDLLNNGRNDIQGTWWLTIFPGLAIFVAVTTFNLTGEGLRDALDPRLKQQ